MKTFKIVDSFNLNFGKNIVTQYQYHELRLLGYILLNQFMEYL